MENSAKYSLKVGFSAMFAGVFTPFYYFLVNISNTEVVKSQDKCCTL